MDTNTKQKTENQDVINVILQLKGKDAERLLAYRDREKLRANATAAYKLIFERLDQVEERAA